MNKFDYVKENTDIITVFNDYIGGQLKRINGNKLRAICPFHLETEKSFTIYEDTDSFYCFGCGVGGTVIDLVMEEKGFSRIEAADDLGIKYNLDLPNMSEKEIKKMKKQRAEQKQIEKIFNAACNIYQKQLKAEHIKSLKERYGLEEKEIRQARIGFTGGVNLYKELKEKGFSDKQLLKSNLVKKPNHKIKDLFNKADRFIIPYLEGGLPVYFATRVYREDVEPKYKKIPTDDTIKNSIYKVGSKNKETLLVTEGELDALAGHQQLKNKYDWISIGSINPSDYKKQQLAEIVAEYNQTILFFDAGQPELEKAFKLSNYILSHTGQIVQIAQPQGKRGTDIADYIRQGKGQELARIIENSRDFLDWVIDEEIYSIEEIVGLVDSYLENIETPEDKEDIINLTRAAKEVKKIYPYLSKLENNYIKLIVNRIKYHAKRITGLKTGFGSKHDLISDIRAEREKGNLYIKEFNAYELAKDTIKRMKEKGIRWGYITGKDGKGILYFGDENKGYWYRESKEFLEKEIGQNLERHNPRWNKDYKKREVFNIMTQQLLLKREMQDKFGLGENPQTDLINVKNGMLDWKIGELKPHDLDYYSITQLNVEYNPEANYPTWKQALKDWIPDKETRLFLQEFVGYCLIPDTSKQKALLLVGNGSNGKSTFLATLRQLLGNENTINRTLQQLTGRFETVSLKDKLANICPDIDPTYIENTAIIKEIIDGENPVKGEYKNQTSFEFFPRAKLLFSANELPKTRDKSFAWLRRFEIVDFPNTFKGNNKVDNFKQKLLKEKSGILNWALEGLRRLKEQGRFTVSDRMRKNKEQYKESNNSVYSFIKNCCEFDPSRKVTREYIYREYEKYCEDMKMKPIGNQDFYEELRDAGIEDINTNFSVCSIHRKMNCDECNSNLITKRKRGFKGLKITSWR